MFNKYIEDSIASIERDKPFDGAGISFDARTGGIEIYVVTKNKGNTRAVSPERKVKIRESVTIFQAAKMARVLSEQFATLGELLEREAWVYGSCVSRITSGGYAK